MRSIVAILALAMLMTAPATRAQDASEKVVVLKVSGMACGECAKTVEKEAKKIDGVKAAKVSQPNGEAEITYEPAKTSPEAIAKRLTQKTGFKATPPPPQENK